MKKIDVLLISRPDHSYNIYKSLLENNLSFVYMVFKLFPKWLNRIIAKNRLREIYDNCSICWSMTLINTLHYNLGWNWLSKIPESDVYQPHIRRFLWRHTPRLIHYWPEYCTDLMRKYKQKNPDAKTLAEIVFLNEQFVLDENAEYLTYIGLGKNLEYIKKNNEITKRVMEFETDFMVPSQLVADSFKKYYPNKKYHIVSYGIPVLPNYKKKKHIQHSSEVVDFVYAGKISIEKGCDLLCQYFSCHPEKHIHLYGNIHHNERHLFEQYKQYTNITFYGSVPKVKLQSLLIQYNAGIHLSRFDSFSLAVAEVIGCGVPVIVSNRTGICSDVEKINAGVVTQLDKDSIENSIDLFCNPVNYNKYIDSIDNYINTPHKTYGDNIVDLYRSLIS